MSNGAPASATWHDAVAEYLVDRRHRLAVAMPAVIATADGELIDVMITNLSSEGFAVDTPRLILIGSNLTISAPEIGDRSATIRWALGYRMGGRFT